MNAPFSIGQKVVSLVNGFGLNKGDEVTVLDIYTHCCCWHVDVGLISPVSWKFNCKLCGAPMYITKGKKLCPEAKVFAPIQTNYADATAEILEKFKPTEDTPDKILIPEKLKSII